jgi:pimeloyl-ACP methyl ester carboxylesterase
VIVVLSRRRNPDPRQLIGATGIQAAPMLGKDAEQLAPGGSVILDDKALLFPLERLAALPPGDYYVQAVLKRNPDLNLPVAPGNLASTVQRVTLNPAHGQTIKLELSQQDPPEELPLASEHVRFVKLPSKLLSEFHGRPMFLRAGVILPRDFDREPDRKYPLRVHIGGYGTRYTNVLGMMSQFSDFRRHWLADDTPRMILLHLDGAGPYGDPYQVNSANNGPYGDAVTQDLIPHVEQQFRGIGQPSARFTDGASTGGWVSLALQVFYPDFFNGCWSHCPDPVDFRAYELINIYRDENAYVNRFGFERPAKRQRNGEMVYSVRHECLMERVMGLGDRWALSGKDWCAWNATFGPRSGDGLPKPLWDGATGKIDRSVTEHWKKYDLRMILEENWKTLQPKLQGKLRVYVGDADEYFLNNAVHHLDAFLKKADPPGNARITIVPGAGHTVFLSEAETMQEMARALPK